MPNVHSMPEQCTSQGITLSELGKLVGQKNMLEYSAKQISVAYTTIRKVCVLMLLKQHPVSITSQNIFFKYSFTYSLNLSVIKEWPKRNEIPQILLNEIHFSGQKCSKWQSQTDI